MTKHTSDERSIILFHAGQSDLPALPKTLVGLRAWGLLEMLRLGAPVPAGLLLPGALSTAFQNNGDAASESFQAELRQALGALGEQTGLRFGKAEKPLLLAVRGSPVKRMPHSPKAVVNLGLSEAGVAGLSKHWGDPRAGWDAYRRLIESYARHVLGVPAEGFENLMSEALEREDAEDEHGLSPEATKTLALACRTYCERKSQSPWPDDPFKQLLGALSGGFRAWQDGEAESYRVEHGLEHLAPTTLIVQAMVHGTARKNSGAGRFATRMPGTGEKKLHGQYLANALGSDLAAGLRLAESAGTLAKKLPDVHREMTEWADRLERQFGDAQDVQFAVEDGRLFLLDSRPASRTAKASLHIALDLVKEGICDERKALTLVDPHVVEEYLHPVLDKSKAGPLLCKGLPASPGSAVGQVVFFAEQAVDLAAQGVRTILIRNETTPEDIDGLKVSDGIVTAHGGLTSHAAVVARGMGKCCVVGASDLHINYLINEMTVGDTTVKRLDWVSIDGNTGEIYVGELPQVQPTLEGGVAQVLDWADRFRTMGVYANADTAEDARRAVELGAGGIGLCRTEHMFFDIARIPIFRKMILAIDETGRSAALAELLPLQRKDFMDIFRVMEGRPVTIRLLDPPLHEFLPRGIRSQTRMSRAMGIPVEVIQQRTETLTENNPMMGHRGCRLAITYPEMYAMQVRAIVEAACIVKKEGVQVNPEIMVPLVSTPRELSLLRKEIEELMAQVMGELGESIPIKIGTMIETPRATVASRAIARWADFYSFGTNDLTQLGYGFSRDDSGAFLPKYLEKGILDADPFIALDQEGVGRMVQIATDEGRASNPELKLGICGEHGGEPASVKFFHSLGLDYVSCSPFRVPAARLAAGQASVEGQLGGDD